MHAILGPSGSGKSTFLTTLCGKASYGHMDGSVGMLVEEGGGGAGSGSCPAEARSFDQVRFITGFVPQVGGWGREDQGG